MASDSWGVTVGGGRACLETQKSGFHLSFPKQNILAGYITNSTRGQGLGWGGGGGGGVGFPSFPPAEPQESKLMPTPSLPSLFQFSALTNFHLWNTFPSTHTHTHAREHACTHTRAHMRANTHTHTRPLTLPRPPNAHSAQHSCFSLRPSQGQRWLTANPNCSARNRCLEGWAGRNARHLHTLTREAWRGAPEVEQRPLSVFGPISPPHPLATASECLVSFSLSYLGCSHNDRSRHRHLFIELRGKAGHRP